MICLNCLYEYKTDYWMGHGGCSGTDILKGDEPFILINNYVMKSSDTSIVAPVYKKTIMCPKCSYKFEIIEPFMLNYEIK